jgi:hypothetical protein
MASCLARAVALALPALLPGGGEMDILLSEAEGGRQPPLANHVSQPARIAHFRAPPDWSPNGRDNLTNALHIEV